MKKYLFGIGVILVAIVAVSVYLFSSSPSSPAAKAQPKTYVALGDSVAAGLGLDTPSDASACGRTDESYPFQVARSLDYSLTNLACSGATVAAGIAGVQSVNKLETAPQLTQLLDRKTTPDFISLTIGANDTQWISILGQCYTDVCGTTEQSDAVGQRLAELDASLSDVLDKIEFRYGINTPRTIVTDYYQLFPTSSTACAELRGIDGTERAWGRSLEDTINERIKTIAKRYDFVTFVHMNFDGHELCTSDSWIQGLRDPAPFHPTADGQAAIAKQIVSAITAKP